MTEFALESYRLAVDVEGTRAYYGTHPLPWILCDCAGCRNFAWAVKTLPPTVTDFFAALGLDPEKPAEIYINTADRSMGWYGGWYHLRGELLAGFPPPEQCIGKWLSLTENFSVAFRQDCALVPEDFPEPRLQMEIDCRLPWLLEELYFQDC